METLDFMDCCWYRPINDSLGLSLWFVLYKSVVVMRLYKCNKLIDINGRWWLVVCVI